MIDNPGVVLPYAKAAYLRDELASVEGGCDPSTALYLSALEVLQREYFGLDADVCEIGVHHGKSFLCLALGLPTGQRAVAIDLFDDAAPPPEGSGRGDREILEKHLFRLGAGEADILASSSVDLNSNGFTDIGPMYRFFSLNGEPTATTTCNDLFVAQKTVIPGGLVALTDPINPHRLGVTTGLFEYWAQGGTLVPALLLPSKLLLTTSVEESSRYRALLRGHYPQGTTGFNVPIGPHELDAYGPYPWIVTDDRGESGLLQGVTSVTAIGEDTTVPVPRGHLRRLEEALVSEAELREELAQVRAEATAYEVAHPASAVLWTRRRRRVGNVLRAVPGGRTLVNAIRRARR